MYTTLLFIQSLTRWLLLASLVYAIYRAWRGVAKNNSFTKTDNIFRRSTATLAHILLLLGILQYFESSMVGRFIADPDKQVGSAEPFFFGVIHIAIMVAAVIVITLGSARIAYLQTHADKHKSMLVWYTVALVLILIAIPWPFSPLVQRPLLRSF